MFRSFRPVFENLEKREVFSAVLGIAPIDLPRTDINDLVVSALESQSSAITVNPATLPNGYLKAAPDSGPSAINRRIGPEIHDLKAAPDSGPSATRQITTSDPDVTPPTSAIKKTTDFASPVFLKAAREGVYWYDLAANSSPTQSNPVAHDAVFAQMGRTGGGFLGLEREHPSILKGLLIP